MTAISRYRHVINFNNTLHFTHKPSMTLCLFTAICTCSQTEPTTTRPVQISVNCYLYARISSNVENTWKREREKVLPGKDSSIQEKGNGHSVTSMVRLFSALCSKAVHRCAGAERVMPFQVVRRGRI